MEFHQSGLNLETQLLAQPHFVNFQVKRWLTGPAFYPISTVR